MLVPVIPSAQTISTDTPALRAVLAAPAAPMLQYATRDTAYRAPWWWRALGFAMAILAIVVIFVDFVYLVAPIDLVVEFAEGLLGTEYHSLTQGVIPLLIVPFYLALPIAWIKLRLLINWRATPTERIACWTIALISAACTATAQCVLWYTVFVQDAPLLRIGQIGAAVGAATLGIGMGWLMHGRNRRSTSAHLSALYLAYVSNAVMCLAGFHESEDPGWPLTMLVAAWMTLEVILAGLRARTERTY